MTKEEENQESFTRDQIVNTLNAWLEYGRQTYKADKRYDELGHRGYFSGDGFAARVLKYVIAEMERDSSNDGGNAGPGDAASRSETSLPSPISDDR